MPKDLKPEAVLFDLYRTLIDITTDEKQPLVWEKLSRFLRYQGLPAKADHLYDTFFHRARLSQEQSLEKYPEVNVLAIFQTMLLELGYIGSDNLAVAMTQLFRVLSILHFELYPDSLSTLQALQRHYRLGLVSDAQRVFSEPELQMTGLEPLMEVIIISSDHWFNKPDPRMFTMALDQLKLSASQAVYVGDSLPRDIFGAQQAGIYAVYLNRQHHTLDSKVDCRPQKMIHTLDELRDWLLT